MQDTLDAELNGPNAPTQLMVDRSRIERLAAALEPFRHMRVVRSEDETENGTLMGLFDGKLVCIGYARNNEIADEINRYFERARVALHV